MKTCSRCKTEKKLTDFYRRRASRDGRKSECKECAKASLARYRADHADSIRDSKRLYRMANLERIAVSEARYRHENADLIREKNRRYRIENAELVNAHNAKRRALRTGAAVDGTYLPTNEELAEYYGKACLHPDCEAAVSTLDHVKPLSKGGRHFAYNFQPLCQSHNSSKQAQEVDYRTGDVWVDKINGKMVLYRPYVIESR